MPSTLGYLPPINNANVQFQNMAHTIPDGLVLKFGRHPSIDAADPAQDIWNGAGLYTGFPTGTPEQVEIFSSSPNDFLTGTGARTVRIFGLQSATSETYTSEDIDLDVADGTNPVTSVNSWYRINRAKVLTAGANDFNEGQLTIRHVTTTANVFAVMPAGRNRTAICAYTIPFNRTGLLIDLRTRLSRANNGAGSADMVFLKKDDGLAWDTIDGYTVTNSSAPVLAFDGYLDPLIALTDIVLRCESVSANLTTIDAGFRLKLFK